MKRILTIAVALLLGTAAVPATAADTPKIGFVNMQRALETSVAGQEAQKRLFELEKKYSAELQTAKEQKEALKAEIDKQGLLWNDKTRRDKEEELRRMERDLSRLEKDRIDELVRKRDEFSEMVSKELLAIIEEIGRAEGYTIILEKKSSAILYAPPAIDLSDRVIKEYDTRKR